MASEFQRRKMAGMFEAMDADANGYLEREDFEALTERWADIRGWQPGSEDYERMRGICMAWWYGLLAMGDENHDGQVSFDELMMLVDQLGAMRAEVYATADAMFDAIDESGDGTISIDEHKQVVKVWKGSDDGVEEVFSQLDLDGDGSLSRDEFRELWFEFWAGADEAAPGRFVFGPV